MRTSDPGSNGPVDPLRGQGLNPAELGDYLPGADQPPDQSIHQPRLQEIDAALAQAELVAQAAFVKILTAIDEKLAQAELVAATHSKILTDPIDAALDSAGATIAAKLGKITSAIDDKLAHAEAFIHSLGGRTPTPAEVAAGLQTGNTFGAVGLPQIVPIGAPGPSEGPILTVGGGIGVGTMGGGTGLGAGTGTLTGGGGLDTIGGGWGGSEPLCPPGYAWTPIPDAVTGSHCAAIVRDTLLGGAGDGGGDGGGDRCAGALDCSLLRVPPQRYDEGFAKTDGSNSWHEVFTRLGTGEPAVQFDVRHITCLNGTDGAQTDITVYALPGQVISRTEGGLLVYGPFPYPGSVAVPCVTVTGVVVGSGSGGGDTIVGGSGGSCPVPGTYACGVSPDVKPPKLIVDEKNVCKLFEDLAGGGELNSDRIFDLLGMGFNSQEGRGALATVLKVLGVDVNGTLPMLVNRLRDFLKTINKLFVDGMQCDVAKLLPILSLEAVVELFSKYAPVIPHQYTDLVRQLSNTACQSEIPSGAEANQAYLSDTISKQVWECWHKAEGNRIAENEAIMKSGRARPDAAQLAVLLRRKQITEEQYHAATRGVGVLTDEDKKRIYDLTQQFPGAGDVVRFMVRDVFDLDPVLDARLSQDFAQKFQGDAADLAAAIGYDRELMRKEWKAHWLLPAYGQLAEMGFRLRPGRVPEAIEVTQDDVRKTIEQNDMLPFWVPRLMEIARPVLNRTDLILAFQERALSDDEFMEGLQDLGYTKDKSQTQLATYDKLRKKRDAQASGLPSARKLVGMFAAGTITAFEFDRVAQQITVSQEQKDQLDEAAHLARDVAFRQCQVTGIKKQFMMGLIDEGTAHAKLADAQIDTGEIDNLVYCWEGQMASRGKQATGSQLCKWANMGLISRIEQAQGLRRIGYNAPTASAIVKECEVSNAIKVLKAQDAADRKARADARKAPSSIAAAEKAAQKELDRRAQILAGTHSHTETLKTVVTLPETDEGQPKVVRTATDQQTRPVE